MIPTIFLHIGTGKTGTTAIQKTLNQHRVELKKFGLLYPTIGCTGVAHYELSRVLGFGPPLAQPADASFDSDRFSLANKLKAEIEQSSAQTVFLSSEHFTNPKNVDLVKSFFDKIGYPVKIIVYLRRHDTWWESLYNQTVKKRKNPPWGRNIEAFILFQKRKNNLHRNHRDLVERWAAVFGKGNVIVRPYEKQQNQPDIVTDILNVLGFEFVIQKTNMQPERANESLSFFALSLIDTYQRVAVDEKTRACLIQYALSLSEKGQRVSILSPEQRRQLIYENMPDYEFIARKYLGREDGRLFYDTIPELDEQWQRPMPPNLMQTVEATVAALAAMR